MIFFGGKVDPYVLGQVSGTLGRAHRIIVLEGGTVVEDAAGWQFPVGHSWELMVTDRNWLLPTGSYWTK